MPLPINKPPVLPPAPRAPVASATITRSATSLAATTIASRSVVAAPVASVPVTKAIAAIPMATVSQAAQSSGLLANPPKSAYAISSGASGGSTSTPTPGPTSGGPVFSPPQNTPAVPPSPLPAPSGSGTTYSPVEPPSPFDPSASQATHFDPNLPPQGNVPDDSAAWNDPAPVAVVSKAVEQAADSNPGIANAKTSTALATVPAASSIWIRILNFFGFFKPKSSTMHGEKSKLTVEQAAQSIVRRIRNGDQNAMGLAVMIGDNARKGNPVAQQTFRHMESYLQKTSGATHAGERRLDATRTNFGWAKAVYLANGPLLHNGKVADVAASFGAENDSRAFIAGVVFPTHPAVSPAHHHGKVVGMARKLQALRMPGSKISDYSATVGWELGE